MSYKWFPKNFFTSHMIGLNWRENSFPEKFCKSFKCLMKTCAFHFALLTFFVSCGNFPVFWNGSILLIRHFSIKVFKWVNRDYCITVVRGVPQMRGGPEGAGGSESRGNRISAFFDVEYPDAQCPPPLFGWLLHPWLQLCSAAKGQ